jgi:hypothetical protein
MSFSFTVVKAFIAAGAPFTVEFPDMSCATEAVSEDVFFNPFAGTFAGTGIVAPCGIVFEDCLEDDFLTSPFAATFAGAAAALPIGIAEGLPIDTPAATAEGLPIDTPAGTAAGLNGFQDIAFGTGFDIQPYSIGILHF